MFLFHAGGRPRGGHPRPRTQDYVTVTKSVDVHWSVSKGDEGLFARDSGRSASATALTSGI
jgi:hypothetical protein